MLIIWAFHRLGLWVWRMKVSSDRNEERSDLQRNMQVLIFFGVILQGRPEVSWWIWVAVQFAKYSALWLSAETPCGIARCSKLVWENTSSWMGVCPCLLLVASSWKFPVMRVVQHTGLLGHDTWTSKANADQMCLLFSNKDYQGMCMTGPQHLSDYMSDFWSCLPLLLCLSVLLFLSFYVKTTSLILSL